MIFSGVRYRSLIVRIYARTTSARSGLSIYRCHTFKRRYFVREYKCHTVKIVHHREDTRRKTSGQDSFATVRQIIRLSPEFSSICWEKVRLIEFLITIFRFSSNFLFEFLRDSARLFNFSDVLTRCEKTPFLERFKV